jgi:hypothetical protein
MRVMVGRMPPMLRDIIEDAILCEPDMQLLPLRAPAHVRARASHDEPEVIVVATARLEGSREGERWLHDWPHARILVIETSGTRSMMYELRPHATPLGELSAVQLIDVIRSTGPEWK